MKKALAFGLIFWLCSLANIKGQPSLGIDSTFFYYTNPTTFNTTDTFQVVLANMGPQTYSGTVHIVYAVDSSANGNMLGLQTVLEDSLFVTLLAGDTMNLSAPLQISSSYFRHGINTVVIWPRARGSANFTTADSLKLTLLVDTTSGLAHYMSVSLTAKMFPNPARQFVYVSLTDPHTDIERVRYLTSEGRVLREEKFVGKLDVSDLSAGTYLIELIGNKGVASRYKIMKE